GSFPRIRGDRPKSPRYSLIPRLFPPHTRGSTCVDEEEILARLVSPAYAGIDPPDPLGRYSRSSFPRIRGDRPPPGCPHNRRSPFPPHTRGSTCRADARRADPPVSPAYAGIDRDS